MGMPPGTFLSSAHYVPGTEAAGRVLNNTKLELVTPNGSDAFFVVLVLLILFHKPQRLKTLSYSNKLLLNNSGSF